MTRLFLRYQHGMPHEGTSCVVFSQFDDFVSGFGSAASKLLPPRRCRRRAKRTRLSADDRHDDLFYGAGSNCFRLVDGAYVYADSSCAPHSLTVGLTTRGSTCESKGLGFTEALIQPVLLSWRRSLQKNAAERSHEVCRTGIAQPEQQEGHGQTARP